MVPFYKASHLLYWLKHYVIKQRKSVKKGEKKVRVESSKDKKGNK